MCVCPCLCDNGSEQSLVYIVCVSVEVGLLIDGSQGGWILCHLVGGRKSTLLSMCSPLLR